MEEMELDEFKAAKPTASTCNIDSPNEATVAKSPTDIATTFTSTSSSDPVAWANQQPPGTATLNSPVTLSYNKDNAIARLTGQLSDLSIQNTNLKRNESYLNQSKQAYDALLNQYSMDLNSQLKSSTQEVESVDMIGLLDEVRNMSIGEFEKMKTDSIKRQIGNVMDEMLADVASRGLIRLRVTNFPQGASEVSIRRIFQRYGPVESVTIFGSYAVVAMELNDATQVISATHQMKNLVLTVEQFYS